ncbi:MULTISPECIES: GNAT family N-acetyltransferase [unclassified Nocardioides]|uniref:GNAT family N-acetyltransferase n=1 Tax=unclassified Nocardioides TaxID=2615069 RepID=UPI00360D2270
MSTTTQRVDLRPATDADREFLVALYASVRADELDQVAWPPGQREAFVVMQYDLQDRQYRQHNPHGTFDVVEVDGRPAGRLYVDRRPTDIRIVDIALAPACRGHGLGTRLVRAVLDEAAASGRTASIHVEVHNPAAALYARLGFEVAEEVGVYRRMEWRSR